MKNYFEKGLTFRHLCAIIQQPNNAPPFFAGESEGAAMNRTVDAKHMPNIENLSEEEIIRMIRENPRRVLGK